MKIHLGSMMSQIEWERESPKMIDLVHKSLHRGLGIHKDGYQYSRAYKNHVWDGIVDFYDNKTETFPTGLLDPLESILSDVQRSNPSLTWEYEDHRPAPLFDADLLTQPIQLLNGDEPPITLYDYQQEAVKSAIQDQVSMVNISTSGGKTEIASGIIHTLIPYLEKDDKVSFACFSKEIFHQSADRLEKRLGIKVGKFGDGIKNIRKVNVVMIQTLNRALQNPEDKVKITSEKDRTTRKMAKEIAPLFIGKENINHLLSNWIKSFHPKTHIDENIKETLIQINSSNLSDKRIDLAMRKYVQMYGKLIEKKAGKAYKKYQEAKDFVDHTRILVLDECHHTFGESNYKLLLKFSAQYRIGLSGTINEKDPMGWQRMQAIFSHKSIIVRNKELIAKGVAARPIIQMLTITEPREVKKSSGVTQSFENMKDWQQVYKYGIVNNEFRNKVICATTVELYNSGRSVLLTVNQTSQGDNISKLLKEEGIPFDYMYGELDSETRNQILTRVRSKQTRVLILTTLGDEGIDVPNLNALILCGGGKTSRGQLQRIGRVLRRKKEDNTAYVFDFVDRTNWYLFNHSQSRIKIYEDEGFEIDYIGGKPNG